MRFFAGMHVPRCHVNTTLSNTIFSREYQLFACWLKMFFWIRVAKSMLSVHLVLEICGLKVVVSFNFAPSAPHVKQRVKSCEPRAAAASIGLLCGLLVAIIATLCLALWGPSQYKDVLPSQDPYVNDQNPCDQSRCSIDFWDIVILCKLKMNHIRLYIIL